MTAADILALIKDRKTVRRYRDTPLSESAIANVVEAGIWGPSLLGGLQPWKFVVVTNPEVIARTADILAARSREAGIGGNAMLRVSAETVTGAKALILVYDTACVRELAKRFDEIYQTVARVVELSAIAAAIQNMVLAAESLGIGTCWLDAPLLCEKEIAAACGGADGELIAILTAGFPAEKGMRAKRKALPETVRYVR